MSTESISKFRVSSKMSNCFIQLENILVKYKAPVLVVMTLYIFLPSPPLIPPAFFGSNGYLIALIGGAVITIFGLVFRALTIAFENSLEGGGPMHVPRNGSDRNGMYDICRNPLFAGNILIISGIALMANSLHFFISVVPLYCFVFHVMVKKEERYLHETYGRDYERYTQRVNRWIPDFHKLGHLVRSGSFNVKRYLVNEYASLYFLFLFIFILFVIRHPQLSVLSPDSIRDVSSVVVSTLTLIFLFLKYLIIKNGWDKLFR